MLITGDPQVHLRLKEIRSVWNGVFSHVEMLHTPAQRDTMLARAKDMEKLTVGDIDTRGIFTNDDCEAACRSIVNGVIGLLTEYGWLSSQSRRQFLYDTRFMRSRGAPFHNDAHNPSWHNRLFWVYVVDTAETDMRLPNLGLSLPMQEGQLLVFDPVQVHGVVKAGELAYKPRHFTPTRKQLYLAGDIPYNKSFWQMLGLETSLKNLRKPEYVETNSVGIRDEDGFLVPQR